MREERWERVSEERGERGEERVREERGERREKCHLRFPTKKHIGPNLRSSYTIVFGYRIMCNSDKQQTADSRQ